MSEWKICCGSAVEKQCSRKIIWTWVYLSIWYHKQKPVLRALILEALNSVACYSCALPPHTPNFTWLFRFGHLVSQTKLMKVNPNSTHTCSIWGCFDRCLETQLDQNVAVRLWTGTACRDGACIMSLHAQQHWLPVVIFGWHNSFTMLFFTY